MMLKTLLAPFRRFARSEDGTIITETIFQDDDGDLVARARQTAIFR